MPKKGIHFNISERKILLRIMDLVSILGVLFLVSTLSEFVYFSVTRENWVKAVVLMVYISVFGTVFELYDLQKASRKDKVYSNIALTVSITVLFYLLTPFVTPFLPGNRLQIIYFYLAILFALVLWRSIYVFFIDSPRFYKKVLVLGETSNIENIVEVFISSDRSYRIVGFINCETSEMGSLSLHGIPEYAPKDIHEIIKKESITEVIVANLNADTITLDIYNDLISLLKKGISIKEFTQVFEDITSRVPIQFVGMDFYNYFPFSRNNKNKLYLFFHRFFDMIFSFIGVFIGILILPVIVIGNLCGNRGPLFYTQERVGENGRIFSIIKFRTMIVNAEENGAVWAEKNDKRVTTFGKFLRRSRLDEFPQFLNILKGEMSLIGPRPERAYFVSQLSKVIPFYETRHIIKPGLTGWAQVKVRYGSTKEDSLLKLQYDLYYIKHQSVFLDVNVIMKTLSTILFFRGQ